MALKLSFLKMALKRNRKQKQKQLDAASKNGVFFNIEDDDATDSSSSCDNSEESTVDSSSTCQQERQHLSWKSTNRPSFLSNQPLIVTDATDQASALGQAMNRQRELPTTWYYSSNHVMVNMERKKRIVAPLIRQCDLDVVARQHAADMARAGRVFHSDPHHTLAAHSSRIVGENVSVGPSIRDIHAEMMQIPTLRHNICHRRYTQMGMGTAERDGQLYLCQIFRG